MGLAQEEFFSLQGKWQLKRSIPGSGEMQGEASFSPLTHSSFTLFYREDGIFNTAVSSSPFYREYIYQLNQGNIEIYFTSRREKEGLFLSLGWSQDKKARAIGSHRCGKDTYLATYDFLNPQTFTQRYDVTGPRKNFRIQTVFELIDE